ncbi:MAG TPA: hypothetical protein VED59_05205, partial [Acidimicrobiales bacterium]|nr:hypothetical protein [Acidimicrobiales bacterium]
MSEYTGALRRAIVAYKYGGDRHWAEPFARLLLRFLDQHATWFEEYEVLCPAPSFTGPNARRLWAPVETVCAALARLADQSWPVETLLIKVVETQPAVGKKGPERRAAAASLRAALTVPSAAIVRGSRV